MARRWRAWWIDGGGDKVRERADGVVGWSLAVTDYGKVQCDRVAAKFLGVLLYLDVTSHI
jgi:hypothetical protein